jgi:hypothetical protein
MHLLVVYDRKAGRIVYESEQPSSANGVRARLDAERVFAGRPEVEVVLLSAASREDMQRTHSRYWMAS